MAGAHVAQAAGPTTCTQNVKQADHRSYARAVYRRPSISRAARRRMARMVRCAYSVRAAANMRGVRKEMARRRDVRELRPYRGPDGQRWAIPWRIVRCESGGSWTAYNRSSAAGPYQIMGMHGRSWPVRTRADRLKHHRIAARLWDAGRGASNWVCKR